MGETLDRSGYVLEFDEDFAGDALDETRWVPYYLPHWSSRERSAARYELGAGRLRLLIEADQPAWCPELDGELRVSSLQTGVRSGQHRFDPRAVVREEQPERRLYTPRHGLVEVRARALADPRNMVALWMIGYEGGERSGEICVFEIFGRDVRPGEARVGMGVHPFGDPRLEDDFAAEPLPIDATAFHVYAADWTADGVAFYVDDALVRTVRQSPDYPLQLMLDVYEFGAPDPSTGAYPKVFEVDYVRGWRRRA